jgi:hypothetical protein
MLLLVGAAADSRSLCSSPRCSSRSVLLPLHEQLAAEAGERPARARAELPAQQVYCCCLCSGAEAGQGAQWRVQQYPLDRLRQRWQQGPGVNAAAAVLQHLQQERRAGGLCACGQVLAPLHELLNAAQHRLRCAMPQPCFTSSSVLWHSVCCRWHLRPPLACPCCLLWACRCGSCCWRRRRWRVLLLLRSLTPLLPCQLLQGAPAVG